MPPGSSGVIYEVDLGLFGASRGPREPGISFRVWGGVRDEPWQGKPRAEMWPGGQYLPLFSHWGLTSCDVYLHMGLLCKISLEKSLAAGGECSAYVTRLMRTLL